MAVVEHSFVRPWSGEPAAAVDRVRSGLRGAGFRLTSPTYWTINGERGSAVAVSKRNVPISVQATVVQAPDGAVSVHVHLADRLSVPLAGGTAKRNFQERFSEIEHGLDVALGFVVPAVVPPAEAPQSPVPIQSAPGRSDQSTQKFDMGKLGQQAGTAFERLTAKTQETASAVLNRGISEPWQKVEHVTFYCPPDESTADALHLQAFAAVAAMVERQPGALPEKLATQLAEFVSRLRGALNAAGAADTTRVRYDLEPPERPILEFLVQQALLREELPVRTLHRCRDCGHEKVSNPDYKKLMERNRKMQALTGAVGLTMRGGGASPFLLVGALFRMKKLDPDYVCPRCQGMESDDTIATFCPECGSLRKEAVLRTCAKCDHDLRAAIAPPDLWHPAELPDG